MHPLVRDLYKRFILVGREYPLGLDFVRQRVKAAFLANKSVSDEELKRCVHRGRYMVKELIGTVQLRKYRLLRQRYDPSAFNPNAAADAFTPPIQP